MLGIASLLALTSAISASANVVGLVLEDKKVDFSDIPHIPAGLSALGRFTEVEYKDVLPEIKDLNGEEADQLVAAFKEQFKLADESDEKVLEQGFEILIKGFEAFKLFQVIALKIQS